MNTNTHGNWKRARTQARTNGVGVSLRIPAETLEYIDQVIERGEQGFASRSDFVRKALDQFVANLANTELEVHKNEVASAALAASQSR